jgi:hypothetical protein
MLHHRGFSGNRRGESTSIYSKLAGVLEARTIFQPTGSHICLAKKGSFPFFQLRRPLYIFGVAYSVATQPWLGNSALSPMT